jgi:hypothetical protein
MVIRVGTPGAMRWVPGRATVGYAPLVAVPPVHHAAAAPRGDDPMQAWIRPPRRLAAGLALAAVVLLLAGPREACGHGGGGSHAGGHAGGGHGHMAGFAGGGPRGMPRSFPTGPRDIGGPRGFDEGRGFDAVRPGADGARFDGVARLDGGRPLDGGGRLDGVRTLPPGHFAGAGELSRADFARIAARGPATGVRPYSLDSLARRGDVIRDGLRDARWSGGRDWYAKHFEAWWPGGWWGGFGWGVGAGLLAGTAWGDLAAWGGYAPVPVSYAYGSTVCYGANGVVVQGSPAISAADYAAQAATLAAAGGPAAAIAKDDEWRSLGVFAIARAEEATPGTFLSLAIDRAGLLRGTSYDAVSDATQQVTGKVDKQTQRAAWTVGDRKTPVFEAGIANLTQRQTTMLVHRDGGAVEQLLLVRVDSVPGSAAADVLDGGDAPRAHAG